MKKGKIVYVGSALFILVIVGLALAYSGLLTPRVKLEKVVLGVPSIDGSLLSYVAQNRQFFAKHGMDVSIRDYETGVLAANALKAGDVDVAIATEFVLIQNGLENRDVRTFGTIGSTNATEIVVRKDRGIVRASDLKGKRVAVIKGAAQEFFLDTFLMQHQIDREDVHLVYLNPTGIATALKEGTIDAGCLFNPHLYNVKKQLGNDAISWRIQHYQDYYLVLVCKSAFIRERSIVIERLLSAFIDAQQFAERDPGAAMAILKDSLKLDSPQVQEVWSNSTFRVTLPQDLITLMNLEAKWLLQRHPLNKKSAPNPLHLVYLEGLKKVRPQGGRHYTLIRVIVE